MTSSRSPRDLTDAQRGQIRALHAAGTAPDVIAKMLGLPARAVSDAVLSHIRAEQDAYHADALALLAKLTPILPQTMTASAVRRNGQWALQFDDLADRVRLLAIPGASSWTVHVWAVNADTELDMVPLAVEIASSERAPVVQFDLTSAALQQFRSSDETPREDYAMWRAFRSLIARARTRHDSQGARERIPGLDIHLMGPQHPVQANGTWDTPDGTRYRVYFRFRADWATLEIRNLDGVVEALWSAEMPFSSAQRELVRDGLITVDEFTHLMSTLWMKLQRAPHEYWFSLTEGEPSQIDLPRLWPAWGMSSEEAYQELCSRAAALTASGTYPPMTFDPNSAGVDPRVFPERDPEFVTISPDGQPQV